MTYYKVLNADGTPFHGGRGVWHLPKGKRPGKWMQPIEGKLEACANGYHLCRRGDLVQWLGPVIFEVEYKGIVVSADNKIVVRNTRLVRKLNTWTDRTARLFACDCAERVLHLYDDRSPDDRRVRNCIEIARKVANGDLPIAELAAARAAVWGAARAAAWDAAWDAGAAARAAAWDAARDAAGDAARDAAGAAGAAARDARAAAWDAGAAARDAAKAAEREWQTERLFDYLEGRAPVKQPRKGVSDARSYR